MTGSGDKKAKLEIRSPPRTARMVSSLSFSGNLFPGEAALRSEDIAMERVEAGESVGKVNRSSIAGVATRGPAAETSGWNRDAISELLKTRKKRKRSYCDGPAISCLRKIQRTRSPPAEVSGASNRCMDCGATETSMWRSGPAGSKTLCNACGIRQGKLKRRGDQLQEFVQTTRAQAVKSSAYPSDDVVGAAAILISFSHIPPLHSSHE